MAIDAGFSQAVSAYNRAASRIESADLSLEDTGQAQGPSFADFMGNMLSDAIATQKKAENLNLQALTGKAELSEVVTAAAEAELVVETMVAMRDKMINAYQEILRMPM